MVPAASGPQSQPLGFVGLELSLLWDLPPGAPAAAVPCRLRACAAAVSPSSEAGARDPYPGSWETCTCPHVRRFCICFQGKGSTTARLERPREPTTPSNVPVWYRCIKAVPPEAAGKSQQTPSGNAVIFRSGLQAENSKLPEKEFKVVILRTLPAFKRTHVGNSGTQESEAWRRDVGQEARPLAGQSPVSVHLSAGAWSLVPPALSLQTGGAPRQTLLRCSDPAGRAGCAPFRLLP